MINWRELALWTVDLLWLLKPRAALHISLLRFNALAAYARSPRALLMGEELAWFESPNGKLVATLIRDRSDDGFAGMILGKDEIGRFRWTADTGFYLSRWRAHAALKREMTRLSQQPDTFHHQHDQTRASLDFFTPVVPEQRLHPSFVQLSKSKGFSPARGIIEPLMRWYEDVDGNFVQQFQTTGFDARIWELYLFAAFVEMGFVIDRIHAIPDFTCKGLRGAFAVEAVTVNPTQGPGGVPLPLPPRNTPDELRIFSKEYMPIKFGSALTSKLKKRYWEKPSAQGLPLVFAIHDFHAPASMTFTRSSLPIYLYGYDWDWTKKRGKLRISPRKLKIHKWAHKTIPSGFFDLEGAEHISAVLFSNSGTISKFNRLGFETGFGSRDILMTRIGVALDSDPNATAPRPFKLSVSSRSYRESWVEGIEIFHNPRAAMPINDELFPGAVHHRLLPNGKMVSSSPPWHPLGSRTVISLRRKSWLRRLVGQARKRVAQTFD